MSEQDQNPYAPPVAAHEPKRARSSPAPDVATKGQRIAGALMIANAVLILIEAVVTMAQPTPDPTTPGGTVLPALIDVGIGGSLLSGSRKTQRWAVIRVVLGALLGCGMQLARGSWGIAALQLILSGGLLALLVGDAGRGRIAAGASAFGVYAAVSLLGLTVIATGNNPIAGLIGAHRTDLEPAPAKHVTGVATHYSLTAANEGWFLRTAEAAKKNNAIVDRWLILPAQDAHLIVIVEDVPDSNLPIEAYADAVISNARKAASDLAVVERHPLPGHLDDGIFLHTTSTMKHLQIEHYYALISDGAHAYQLVAFADHGHFSSVAADFRSIIESFRLPSREADSP